MHYPLLSLRNGCVSILVEELAKRLLLLRAGGIAVIALLLSFSLTLQLPLAYDKLLIICLEWVVLHGFIVFSQRRWRITPTSLTFQLTADTIIVASLLAISGGVHNPFFGLLLLPLLLAVGILPSRQQNWLLALVLMASTLLIFVPSPINAVIPAIPNQVYSFLFWLDGGVVRHTPFNPLDVLAKIGLWMNVGLTAILVTFFLAKLHQRLQQQQQALQQVQLEGQSQQNLLNLSLAAASTAHELSTPLATMSLLVNEAADAYRYNEPENAQAALEQIQQLIYNCKSQISISLKQHQLERSDALSLVSWPEFIHQLLMQWKSLRPQVKVSFSVLNPSPNLPMLINLPILTQILTSLLNNASDASEEALELTLNWTETEVSLCLLNQGTGFPEDLLRQFPKPLISQKQDGHGVGLALAHASLQQLGGKLLLTNPIQGGAQACIVLPKSIDQWQLRQNDAPHHTHSLS